ncbi:flexible cuticle protein 12-like [Bacillus rossius redtenbacheri]|uniref:flexible cuticle protein 12-like n=1 Tax=Bacillus rossius redtenbacheri TaxID=93214 RepID=UPI002FDE802F
MQGMTLVVLAAVLAAVLGAPQYKEPIHIIAYENNLNIDGSFGFGYESEDGTKHEQAGSQRALGPKPEDAGTVIEGAYSYTGDDGKRYELRFTADENGFQPVADFLPPLPEHAARQIAAAQAEDRAAGPRPL